MRWELLSRCQDSSGVVPVLWNPHFTIRTVPHAGAQHVNRNAFSLRKQKVVSDDDPYSSLSAENGAWKSELLLLLRGHLEVDGVQAFPAQEDENIPWPVWLTSIVEHGFHLNLSFL